MSQDILSKATLTVAEFCKVTGLSRSTVWRLRDEGKLPHCKIGRRIFFTQEQLTRFLSNFAVEGGEAYGEA